MELNTVVEIIEALKSVPVYIWVIGAIVIVIVFADRKKWDRKARFPNNGVKGPGFIEVDCYRKKGMIISVELLVDEKYSQQRLEIYVNKMLALSIPANKARWGNIKYKGKYNLAEPGRGSTVEVKANGQTILTGEFQ